MTVSLEKDLRWESVRTPESGTDRYQGDGPQGYDEYFLRNASARHESSLYAHDLGVAGSSPIVRHWVPFKD